ncbi:MAG: zinc-binding alcohol dehydrogenase [Candidatus Omnitrophica bacterium]|nr:zinc-binding alcohol dehydrogenase [Candidatus Omnitrophota bacterium]MCM8802962.1 zinc-binding alcohol dehydrogenase [Candidatus Omnitrophota bacterium]
MKKRICAYYDYRGRVFVQEEPIPELKEGEVLVKVNASLISPGTEVGGIKKLRESPAPSEFKRPFGYSISGEIVDIGKNCKSLKIGQRVVCMGTGYALHTDYACVPQNLCVELPKGVDFEEGSFIHLATTALWAVRRGKLEIGENVVVIGLGIIGQIVSQLSKISGCHVIGWDKYDLRLEIAKENGIDRVVNSEKEDAVKETIEFSRNYGIDTGFICFGGEATETIKLLIKTMKTAPDTHKMGKIVIVGGASLNLDFPVFLGNINIYSSSRTGPGYHDVEWEYGKDYPPVFVQWNTKRNMEEILILLKEKKLNVKSLITDRFSLTEISQSVEKIINYPDKTLGVILKP